MKTRKTQFYSPAISCFVFPRIQLLYRAISVSDLAGFRTHMNMGNEMHLELEILTDIFGTILGFTPVHIPKW